MKLTASSFQVEGIQVHADEGGATQTRGGVYWLILPAGCLSLSLSFSHTHIWCEWYQLITLFSL